LGCIYAVHVYARFEVDLEVVPDPGAAARHGLAHLVGPVIVAGLFADAVGVEPVFVAGGLVALVAAVWSRAQGSRVVPARAQ
jgi:hypothetical protein